MSGTQVIFRVGRASTKHLYNQLLITKVIRYLMGSSDSSHHLICDNQVLISIWHFVSAFPFKIHVSSPSPSRFSELSLNSFVPLSNVERVKCVDNNADKLMSLFKQSFKRICQSKGKLKANHFSYRLIVPVNYYLFIFLAKMPNIFQFQLLQIEFAVLYGLKASLWSHNHITIF